MSKKSLLTGLFLTTILIAGVFPQNQSEPNMEELLKEALSVRIQAKIFHELQNVIWQSDLEKLTIPGRPITINLQNEQAKLSVHFTPYRKTQGGLILIAQSEIWLKVESTESTSENLRYFTSMKSIPLDYEELIYFYPLGKLENLSNPEQIHIEMILSIIPYMSSSDFTKENNPEGAKSGN